MTVKERIQKLRALFAEKEIDALLVSQADNRYYLSNFRGSDGYLLVTANKQVLAVDFRYIEEGKRDSPDYEIFKAQGPLMWFTDLTTSLNIKRLGFESADVSYAFYRQLTDVLQKAGSMLQFIPTGGLVESLRVIKEPGEIELIQKAVDISDDAVEHIQKYIQPGTTELAVAWEIERFMRESGSEPVPFELIAGAGPNGALPHAHPGEYDIRAGEPIVIDIGAKYKKYTSDLTRTICAGTPDEKFRKIYDIVLGAHLTGIAIIKEGMTGEEADNIARIVINESGYGETFGHSLGHGVGLATHENPRLGMRSTDVLKNGMVFTIEPGIYLPDWGGVRIEDTVVMENGRIRSLSHAKK
jgi:Xaa-Pro aminopeptidase